MKSRAAVLHGTDQEWRIEEIEVDAPKAGEVIVEWKAAGLCHSDEHMVTGDMVPPREAWPLMGIDDLWPVVGGHEGAGVIAEVGPGSPASRSATTCRRRSCRRVARAATARPVARTCATPVPVPSSRA
jgi:Zn-dependent alcohol dehydrogenase